MAKVLLCHIDENLFQRCLTDSVIANAKFIFNTFNLLK